MSKNYGGLNKKNSGDMSEALRSRFRGTLIGTMVGDALGMPVEGYPRSVIKHTVGEVRDMLPGRQGKGRDYVISL